MIKGGALAIKRLTKCHPWGKSGYDLLTNKKRKYFMNPDTRNLIAAICLSMSVLIGYQILFGEPAQQNVKKEQQLVDKNNEPSIELPKDNNTSLTEVTKKTRNIDRINIVNDELEGSISLLGARIDDLVLKNYRKTLDPESDQIRFLKKLMKGSHFSFNLAGVHQIKIKFLMEIQCGRVLNLL